MKIEIIDSEKFKKTYGIYVDRKISFSGEYQVYAIMQQTRRKYVLIYLEQFNRLDTIRIDDNVKIVDEIKNEKWVFKKKYKGGYQICGGGACYFQPIKYKNVYAPQWMVEDKRFFLDLIEEPDIALKIFFEHEITTSK